MNKKGFTLIEVTVSIVIVSLILVTLLGSLVRLREIYTSSEENSEVAIYASSVSRIINKDVINNKGIRDIVCNELKNECELTLANEEKRRIEILTINDEEDEEKIKHEEIRTTLRYTDITEEEKLLYMKTLKLDRYTNTETKEITTKGYNFLNIESKKNEYEGEQENKDIITEIKIEIYNGEDRNDKRYDIGIYGTTRYDYKNIIGRTYKIEFDDKDADVIGTRGIEEEYGVGYYKYESAHRKEDRIEKIETPQKEGKVFGGYYYKDGVHEDILVVDIEGNIVTNNRLFTSNINKKDEYPKVEAVWEECSGGYEIVNKKCIPKEFTITFSKENGTGGSNNLKVKYKTKLSNIEVPTRENYIFDGYYTGRNGEGTKYYDKDGVAQVVAYEETTDITLYAKWNDILLAGSGTQEDPYKIQCIEDLVELSNNVNKKGNSYSGKYFELTRNLDFKTTSSYRNSERTDYGDINGINGSETLIKELTTGSGFEPIGVNSPYFQGIFDGKNYKISNLYLNNTNKYTNKNIGLFGGAVGSTIRNLEVNANIHTTNANYMGIIGYVTNSTIDNVKNDSSTIISSDVGVYGTGGIIGAGNGNNTIKNTTNYAQISNGAASGGIIGAIDGGTTTIDNCENNGIITQNKGGVLGGIVGQNWQSNLTIKNSHNKANLQTNKEVEAIVIVGGIIGHNTTNGAITINNSSNSGNFINNRKNYEKVTGVHFGGIVGANNGNEITINDCFNSGNMSNSNRMGGIISTVTSSIVIINRCINIGNLENSLVITTTGNFGGGIVSDVGVNGSLYILNSANTGTVSTSTYSSGFTGVSYGKLSIINSYNLGKISSSNNSSGFVGNISSVPGYFKNLYNAGALSGTKNYAIGPTSSVTHDVTNTYHDSTIQQPASGFLASTSTPLSTIKSTSFVNTLNTNKSSINLSSIDSNLSGYTLCDWKLGTSGYPELDCK